MIYLKQFDNLSDYEAYVASENFIAPNVSFVTDLQEGEEVKYVKEAPTETRLVCKYNITTTGVKHIVNEYADPQDCFTEIEIDGVVQPITAKTYNFTTTGEHTAKFTLKDPTTITDGIFEFNEDDESMRIMTAVTIPNGVTTISSLAFRYNLALENVTIPNTVTIIEEGCFSDTAIKTLVIPEGLITIKSQAFQYCNVESITFPSTLETIEYEAFDMCSYLSSITCLATTAPEVEFDAFPGGRSGTLRVPTGSDYSSWLSELGSGWQIEYI